MTGPLGGGVGSPDEEEGGGRGGSGRDLSPGVVGG